MLTQVLTANPQSARMQAVWDALYERTNQLPQYMLNAISNNINVSSTKEVLENELSYYLSQKQWSFNEIQYFTIEYSITETPGKSTFIEIHSMDGRLIQQIALTKHQYQLLIDTRQMAKGMYICSLKQNGLVIQTAKVNVVKK